MRKFVKKRITRQVLEDVICDMCGGSCYAYDKINIEASMLTANWGYNSKKDGEYWCADFCESCSDKIAQFISENGGNVRNKDRVV